MEQIMNSQDNDVTEVAVPSKPEPEVITVSSGESSSDDSSLDGSSDESSDSSKEHQLNENQTTTGVVAPLRSQYIVVKTNYMYNMYQSIKYKIWCSTISGNKTLDSLYSEFSSQGPIYLLAVYNDQYVFGIAKMQSKVDSTKYGPNI